MVARKLLVHHKDSQFEVEYETDDGLEVLKFQLFSLTSIEPDEQKIVGAGNLPVRDESDLEKVADSLRLLSVDDDEPSAARSSDNVSSAGAAALSDEELARMLQAEEDALFFQQFQENGNRQAFESRVHPYVQQVMMYEDPVRQEAARKSVPVDVLEEKALVALAKEGNFRPSEMEENHAFLLQLLFWFKKSFSWVNSPACESCGKSTVNIGMGIPLPSETQFGASRVENFRCNACSRTTRFPRYNDPIKLIETRKGRCGEWANCFTLYCRAFGYDSRLILDFTDHVWTECFSPLLERWIHLDPCEGIYDNPLLYEKGWNKKLNYVIAIAKDGVYDVTKRYTRKWHEVLPRRNIATEPVVYSALSDITKECRNSLPSSERLILKDRDKKELEELEEKYYHQDDLSKSLPGRQSGAQEWRMARSELGSDSLSSSSCPVRVCIDDHVTKIYEALSFLLSELANFDLSKSEVVEFLEMLKKFASDLSGIPFRKRTSSVPSESFGLRLRWDQIGPSLNGLFASFSLKWEKVDDRVDISLAGDPVKTSLALEVAFDAIDDCIDNLKNINNFSRQTITHPLLKLNRISSGYVQASGEELPFGIATAAFDGTRLAKWEEPNGAKGCFLTYKTMDNNKFCLEAYDFVSANDVPERDPMDWIVEGSVDGGSSWFLLDKRSSQLFEKRFQRKTYQVEAAGTMSNAFRFRFLAVRESKNNSRFQIGSIDLYAANSSTKIQ